MAVGSIARFEDKVKLISGAGSGFCSASAEIIAAEGSAIAAFDSK